MSENDFSTVPNLQDTSDKVSEVLEDTIIDSTPDPAEEDSVFEELGVTPFEIIKYIIIFFLIFGGFVYGGYKVFRIFFPSNSQVVTQVSEPVVIDNSDAVVAEPIVSTPVNPSSSIDEVIDSTSPQIKVFSKSLPLAFEIMETNEFNSKLESYLLSYKSMKNIYNIDLSGYLDASSDRELAYFQYINEYKAALVNLKLSVNSLNSEISYFQDVVLKANQEVDVAESVFFNKVQNLDESDLNESLVRFQTLSKKKNDLTAELKSRQAILSRIGANVDAIDKKFEAIELNKDAYIKGVTITNVEGVDLNLINN